jgi:hypothetical protein
MSTFPSYGFPDVGPTQTTGGNSGSFYGFASTASALQGILKEYYGPQQLKVLVYRRNKLFAMLHKEEDWAGEVVPIPTVWANPSGGSRQYAYAYKNQTASGVAKFFMQWAQDFQLVTVTNLVQLASRNDSGAFLKAIQREMNGGLKTSENRWAGALYRSYTGSICQAVWNNTTNTLTLTDPVSITQFEWGQTLEIVSTDGASWTGGTNANSYGYVCAVDRTNSVVYITNAPSASMNQSSVASPSGAPWTGNGTYYVRVSGDNNAGAGLSINGLADWLTTSNVSGSDSFNGVNRSVDQTRLSGVKWNGSNQSIEEAAVDAAALAAREDGNPELGMTNHLTFAALEKALGAKREYVNYEHDEVPGIGFSGLRIHGADEEINIFADRNCPGKRLYLLDPDSWTLGSMKPLPHIITELDGLTELRDPNSDATQIRIGGYGILATDAPGHNCVVQTQI